jgi:acyl-CoA reductase-like NAD-dependent aldehyde dehydrogenase
MTIFVYDDNNKFDETLKLCDTTSPYGLTGSIFSNDKLAMIKACRALRYAVGNFYINDKLQEQWLVNNPLVVPVDQELMIRPEAILT